MIENSLEGMKAHGLGHIADSIRKFSHHYGTDNLYQTVRGAPPYKTFLKIMNITKNKLNSAKGNFNN